jgi:hypothetical protein
MGIFATEVAVSVLLIACRDQPFSGGISVKTDVLQSAHLITIVTDSRFGFFEESKCSFYYDDSVSGVGKSTSTEVSSV